jgi:hypothetical protein
MIDGTAGIRVAWTGGGESVYKAASAVSRL